MSFLNRNDVSGSLFDNMLTDLNIPNDAALARMLGVTPPVISKIRNGRLVVGSTMLIRVHELTGWTIADIKAMLADREQAA